MSPLKIYSTLLSANGRKVQAVCSALNIKVEFHETNVYSSDGQSSSLLAINPLGQIPVLIDNTLCLTESNAIVVYLAEKFANNKMYASTPEEKAIINKWLFWESSQWQPALIKTMGTCVGHKLIPAHFPKPNTSPNWRDESTTSQLKYLDQSLASRTWITGDELSIADFTVAAMSTYFHAAQFPYEDFPHISSWLTRLSLQKAWQITEHPLWQKVNKSIAGE